MIHTSNFSRSGRLPNAVSIAYSSPPWFQGAEYRLLAPSNYLLQAYKSGRLGEEEYTAEYNRKLQCLDPGATAKHLEGKVLLCWEGKGKFCHRQLVREWFLENGFLCMEL